MTNVVIIVVVFFAGFILLATALARMYRKAGPHEALIVYGLRGSRVIKGSGTVIWPMVRNRQAAIARTDVVRCGAAAGHVYAGRAWR